MKTVSHAERAANRGVRIVTTKVYTAAHLKRYYPEVFKRAHAQYCENAAGDTYRQDEIIDSLKGLFEAAGVRMKAWELGGYCHWYIRAEFPGADVDDERAPNLKGARAFAWIENNLLAPLRAPWGLPHLKKGEPLPEGFTRGWITPSKKFPRGAVTADDNNPVTRWTKPGELRECPFTGICYDMDLLDALLKSVKSGETLREAFEGLADEVRRLIEGEAEYDREESSFLDAAAANGWEYTRDGAMEGSK